MIDVGILINHIKDVTHLHRTQSMHFADLSNNIYVLHELTCEHLNVARLFN